MGLTKQYLSYKPVNNFNIIVSQRSNVAFVTIGGVEGRYVAVGGAENVLIWDLRTGQKHSELKRSAEAVACLAASPDRLHLAVGFVDGVVEIFNLETQSSVCTFASHRSTVSCIRYDSAGLRLVSGGHDTDLVVSDVVAQAGVCRLAAHTGPITDARFMERFGDILVSASKDTQIKFWNLETQNCFKTIVDHRTEVWGVVLMRDEEFLVAGSTDSTLRVYGMAANDGEVTTVVQEEGEDDSASPIRCNFIGLIQRSGKGRTMNLSGDDSGRVLACHGTDDRLELFYFCDEGEAMERLTKRLKKLQVEEDNSGRELSLTDKIKRLSGIKAGGKIKSFALLLGDGKRLHLVATFGNNLIKLFGLEYGRKNAEATVLRTIAQHGHQTEVRCVAFSSDNFAIASASGDTLKLWNRESQACLRTVESEYALSVCFVPGDRHVLVGCKSGKLLIVDISVGEVIESIPGHEAELWTVCLLPDLRGCVTGGGDKTVKIWSFELVEDPTARQTGRILSLLHRNTLVLEETVLGVRLSPNQKYIAVALLDNTVKIFFLDTFKFYLSLYGHNLPVLCLDICYDSTIIATGSADRNVKIWGMDFGDCHRSLFAHDDSVMALQFVPKTHLFFTVGKDGRVKQWDADTFQKIVTLPGHLGEAYSLAVSPNARFLVTCGADRTLRLFERTNEPLVLQDAQEEEREEAENRQLATEEDSTAPTMPGLKLPSRKTVGAEKSAESILECLDACQQFEAQPSLKPPLMAAYGAEDADDFLLNVLNRIRASDLEEALLILPFSSVCEVLKRIPRLAETRKDQTELVCKVALFLFRVHQKPIASTQSLLPVIREIAEKLQAAVVELRDMIGFNLHGMQLLQWQIEEAEGVELFRDASKAKRQKQKRNKKRELTKRLHIQMST